MAGFLATAVFCAVLGLACVLRPRGVWSLYNLPTAWAYKDRAEPSDAGLRFVRGMGIFWIFVGLAIALRAIAQ